MPTATQKVFSTAELLEIILLEVVRDESASSMRTLLLSQRVSSDFCAGLQTSKKLRRTLWLEDGPVRPLIVNPLIASSTGAKHVFAMREINTTPYGSWQKEYVNCITIASRGLIDEETGVIIKQSWQKMCLAKGKYRVQFQGAVNFFNDYDGVIPAAPTIRRATRLWKVQKGLKMWDYMEGRKYAKGS